MCGIAGIICSDPPGRDLLQSRIEKMTNVIAHRGPDGEGHYFGDHLALGHRRLSIIDLSPGGAQPMTWNGMYTITYNGEIYNYIELRIELQVLGFQFISQSDTEVILAAYHQWGVDCVSKFNGMWSFAIFDATKNILFCSRDRFGVKPFYYTRESSYFAFGSEIKQLLSIQDHNPKINDQIAVNYLVYNMMDHDDQTFFQNIFKLQGGHNLIYNLNTFTFTTNRYYEISYRKEVEMLNDHEAFEFYSGEFYRAVNYRLRSDVKVGTCLSGGLDSSSIAATASKIHRQNSNIPFCAITAESTQKEYDETSYAKLVAESAGLDWYLTKPEKNDFVSNLNEVIYTQEYPFIGPTVFMQYFVMKKAKESGITVLLDGQGGDESLLGYSRYIPSILFEQGYWSFFVNIGQIKENYSVTIVDIIKNLVYFTTPRVRQFRQCRAFPSLKKQYSALLNTKLLQVNAKAYKNPFELQKLEFTSTQIPSLLRFEDKNSMRHSIETRLPFLDWELVELSLSLKTSMKLNGGWSKYVLRKYAEAMNLPNEIAWRKNKLGFNAPMDDWLYGMGAEMSKVIFGSELLNTFFNNFNFIKKLNNHQIWRLYNFAKWEQLYKVAR